MCVVTQLNSLRVLFYDTMPPLELCSVVSDLPSSELVHPTNNNIQNFLLLFPNHLVSRRLVLEVRVPGVVLELGG
jgi:hypothetical protein